MRLFILFKALFLALAAIGEGFAIFSDEWQEEKIRIIRISERLFLSLTCLATAFFSIYHVYSAIFPDIRTEELTLEDSSGRLFFETTAHFYDDSEESFSLSIPQGVVKDQLWEDGLVDGERYIVTFEDRSNVVAEIHMVKD